MGFGGPNPQQLMKQARKMQADMEKLQEELGEMTVEATAGGGVVKAVITCDQELRELIIDKEAVDPEDVEMLQDTIIAAINEAIKESKEKASAEMSKITGRVKIPGMF